EEQITSYYDIPNRRVDGFVEGKSQVALEYCRRNYLFDDKAAGEGADFHADNWFTCLRRDVFPLLPQKRKPGDRVKIAILDTGIDMSEPFISTNRTRITPQSFLSDETSIEDVHGHGTHATALLLRVAEHADLYVARIAKTENSLDPKSIEQAIEAAIDEEVNIISMSFGFPAYERHLKGIQRAIGKAYSASILIFCAACNGGGNTSIAYPANQNEVICVNSANGLGIPSEYNPGEAQEGRDLCALGEAVKSSWPKLQQQRKSGTSIATPIAAALAAVVLDYFRQNMPDSDEFMVSKLQMRKGMLEVLVKLMGRKRSGYYYLDPGKLFNKREPNIYGSILSVLVNV
ncbi:hypothetical protein MMC31_007313, partial [Peltigera leucophlebia]|nr:hypothetical protein [Peltigera leucophlebia]